MNPRISLRMTVLLQPNACSKSCNSYFTASRFLTSVKGKQSNTLHETCTLTFTLNKAVHVHARLLCSPSFTKMNSLSISAWRESVPDVTGQKGEVPSGQVHSPSQHAQTYILISLTCMLWTMLEARVSRANLHRA